MKLPPDIERVALIGWHVYPASTHSKAACFRGATDMASCDLDVIARWARDYPSCNWRVVAGPSNLFGLDCDTPPLHANDGITALAELAKVHGGLLPRPMLRSGGGGLALFFSARHGERIIGESGHPAPGIDPRRGRQSQTIPPSIHPITKQPYRWLSPPWELTPPRAPEWLLRLVAPPPEPTLPPISYTPSTDRARRRLNQAIDAILRASNGARNATLNSQAFAVARHIASGMLGEAEARNALYAAAQHAGLPHPEIKATLRSAFAAGYRAAK